MHRGSNCGVAGWTARAGMVAISGLLCACAPGGPPTVQNSTAPVAALPAVQPLALPGSQGNSATMTWIPPRDSESGEALVDLAGYRIYEGDAPDRLTLRTELTNPGLTAYVVDGLDSGTHYFAITALTLRGTESRFSAVLSKTIL